MLFWIPENNFFFSVYDTGDMNLQSHTYRVV